MEKQFSELELNIKAIEAMGLKVKDFSFTQQAEKSAFIQLKDIDKKQGIVSFYFAAFGNKDSDGDIIVKGAYTKTFKENASRIKHLYNHNKTQSPGVLIEFGEDNHGAWMVSKLANTTLGKDVLIEYDCGIITEHSQGFQPIKEKQEGGANYMTEIKLWEGTTLTAWGANYNTPMIGLKESDIETLIKNIETVLHSSNISDEGGKKLEAKMNELLLKRKQAVKPVVNYNSLIEKIVI